MTYIPLVTIIACLYLFADDTTAVIKGNTSHEVNTKAVSVNYEVATFATDKTVSDLTLKRQKFCKFILLKLRTLKNPQ
jgi:hypothetical protein